MNDLKFGSEVLWIADGNEIPAIVNDVQGDRVQITLPLDLGTRWVLRESIVEVVDINEVLKDENGVIRMPHLKMTVETVDGFTILELNVGQFTSEQYTNLWAMSVSIYEEKRFQRMVMSFFNDQPPKMHFPPGKR